MVRVNSPKGSMGKLLEEIINEEMIKIDETDPRTAGELNKIKEEMRELFPEMPEDRLEKLSLIVYGVVREKVVDQETRKQIAIDKMWRGARYIEGYLKNDFRVEKEIRTKENPLVLIVKVYY